MSKASIKSEIQSLPSEITPFRVSDLYDHVGLLLSLDNVPGMDALSLQSGMARINSETSGDLEKSRIVSIECHLKSLILSQYMTHFLDYFASVRNCNL